MRFFIDTAVSGGAQETLLRAALLFFGLAVVSQLLAVAATYLSEGVAWTATNALRLDLLKHCLGLDQSFYYLSGGLADHIILLHESKVEAEGKLDALLETSAEMRRLWRGELESNGVNKEG
jgi:ABC-type multidrug transport system fused ATPase/permease subunit